jgi:hypothetical protein
MIMVGSTLSSKGAVATTQLSYNPGDLFLGIRAEGGIGQTKTILVKLGTAASFRDASTPSSLSVGDLRQDLINTFGVSWATRTDLKWGMFATSEVLPVSGDAAKTLYASKLNGDTTPWPKGSSFAQGPPSNKMAGLTIAYATGVSTTNSQVVLVQNNTDQNSYASNMPGGASNYTIAFNYFNGAFEGAITDALDLVRNVPAVDGSSIGRFSISNLGVISFAPAVTATPAPVISSTTSATGTNGRAFSYQITASNTPTSFTASGLPAGLSLNGTTGLISGTPSTAGTSSVTLGAINAGGTGTAVLTLSVVNGTDANLASLTLTSGTTAINLTPGFTSSGTSYTASVVNAVTSVTLTPMLSDSLANVLVAGGTNLVTGPNTITATVTAQDGTTRKTYQVVVNRLSNNADLSGLALSTGTSSLLLSPTFSASGTSYSISVANAVTSVSATPTLSDTNANVVITGGTTLAVGPNPVIATVTAQDGTVKVYQVTVTRAASSTDANLTNLTLRSGTSVFSLSPVFTSSGTSYTTSVPNAVTSVTVTPALSDTTAGVVVVGGSSLTVGTNTITATVTAQDQVTVKTYRVLVTRLSNNADLSSLTLTGGTAAIVLSPTFSSGVTNYSTTVANAVSLVTVTPTLSDTTASVAVTGSSLSTGSNTVEATVTAQDGSIKRYQVAVTRLSAPPVITSALSVTGTTGLAFRYDIVATENPQSFSASGLPSGLSLNAATGVISGTVTTAGSSSVVISASNNGGADSRTLSLAIIPPPPVVQTGSASSVSYQSAVMNGTVNPNGLAGLYYFEYGTTDALGSRTDDALLLGGTTAQPVSGGSSASLNAATTYYYRLVAVTSSGSSLGSKLTLKTLGGAPTASVTSVSGTGLFAATASTLVNPNGLATTVSCQYGKTSAYGSTTTSQSLAASGSASTLNFVLQGLRPHTTYHLRCVASNSSGSVSSSDATYRTPARADWNRDGYADLIVLPSGSGSTSILSIRDGWKQGDPVAGPVLSGSVVLTGVADFDGDGKVDWVVSPADRKSFTLWKMDGVSWQAALASGTAPSGYGMAGAADVNLDGVPDLLVFNPTTLQSLWLTLNGALQVTWTVNGPALSTAKYAGFNLVAVDDLDGDGEVDYLYWNKTNHKTVIVLAADLRASRLPKSGPTIPAGWQLLGADGYLGANSLPNWILFKPGTAKTAPLTAFWKMANTTTYGGSKAGPSLPSGATLLVAP